MGRLTENLDAITNKIRQSFEAKNAAREKVLPICREVIRFSSLSIRALHREELEKSQELLNSRESCSMRRKMRCPTALISAPVFSSMPRKNMPKAASPWRWLKATSSRLRKIYG